MRLAAALNIAQVVAGGHDPGRVLRRARLGARAGRRRRPCSSSAPCSPRSPSTRMRIERSSGCSARGSTRSPRTRCCARRWMRSRPSSASSPPKLYLIPGRVSARARRGARAGRLVDRVLDRPARCADARRARGRDRARARARPSQRRPDADLRRHARRRPGRPLPDRWLVRTGAARDPRPDRGRVRPPPPLAQARARGGPDGVVCARFRATGSRTRSSSSTAPAISSRSRRARRQSRCTPSIRSPRRAWRRSSSRTRRCRSGYCA